MDFFFLISYLILDTLMLDLFFYPLPLYNTPPTMYILYLTYYAALISLVMDILTNLYLSSLLHRKVQRS